MSILGIDHVQLAMPAGGETAAIAFYVGILGFREIEKPKALQARGGAWFVAGSVQLHLGVDPNFVPAAKAHPAFRVAGLSDLRNRCRLAGLAPRDDIEIAGVERFFLSDPFGNRLEFLEPQAAISGAASAG